MLRLPRFRLLLVICLFFLSGCGSLKFQTTGLAFPDPASLLPYKLTEANETEKLGILLRLKPDTDATILFEKETTLFIQVKEKVGKQTHLHENREETFSRIPHSDNLLLTAKTEIKPSGGRLVEKVQVSPRGEIIRLVGGEHKSRLGTFNIKEWSRTPFFPDQPARRGDTWQYEEKMLLQMSSGFIQQENPTPFHIHANVTLVNFATLDKRRCAVLQIKAKQEKEEKFKIFFLRELDIQVASTIEETMFFDYQRGEIVGRVIKTKSITREVSTGFTDESVSQSIVKRIYSKPTRQ